MMILLNVSLWKPPRYAIQGETTPVCHLHRVIYGLKQSPCAWFAKFSQRILSQGLTPCEVDHSVFQNSNSAECIILAVFVDEILVIRSDMSGITRVKEY